MGAKCQMTSCCYLITCKECDPGGEEVPKEKSRYIGQSGTTLHKRQKTHVQGIKGRGVLAKHLQENHSNEKPDDPAQMFKMIPIKSSRTVVDRLVREGVYIQEMEESHKGVLMNSRSEWGRGKMIRFDPQVHRA